MRLARCESCLSPPVKYFTDRSKAVLLLWIFYVISVLFLLCFCARLFIACGALAASISVGIVIPSTWFVYLYKQTVSITVVVIGTKQFNEKTTHRQQLKTGFVQKWENRSPELFQDYSRTFSFFKDSISSQFCITQRFKVHFFSVRSGEMNRRTPFL